jgi:hypothetical protein
MDWEAHTELGTLHGKDRGLGTAAEEEPKPLRSHECEETREAYRQQRSAKECDEGICESFTESKVEHCWICMSGREKKESSEGGVVERKRILQCIK